MDSIELKALVKQPEAASRKFLKSLIIDQGRDNYPHGRPRLAHLNSKPILCSTEHDQYDVPAECDNVPDYGYILTALEISLRDSRLEDSGCIRPRSVFMRACCNEYSHGFVSFTRLRTGAGKAGRGSTRCAGKTDEGPSADDARQTPASLAGGCPVHARNDYASRAGGRDDCADRIAYR